VVESASEIGLTRRLGEEEYCKNRAQDGAILAVPVRMADRRECSDEEPLRNVAIRRDGHTMVSFEVKKKIPVVMICSEINQHREERRKKWADI
jgi:hypothetical protein